MIRIKLISKKEFRKEIKRAKPAANSNPKNKTKAAWNAMKQYTSRLRIICPLVTLAVDSVANVSKNVSSTINPYKYYLSKLKLQ